MSADVAALLRSRIRSGDLAVGARLPSQRELAVQFGVSRQTIFEGLSRLEEQGYVTTRRGATGGTFVREPDVPLQQWIAILRADIDTFDEVIDFRIGVEGRVAALAAQRRTAADVEAMHLAIDEMAACTTMGEYRATDAAFHRALAGAARNARLEAAVFDARAELFFPVDRIGYRPTIAATAREHATILRAVERGDAAAAARAVTTHLEHTRSKLHSLLHISERHHS